MLESFISEGVSCQKVALEGKRQYLHRVQEWLISVCKDNNESEPYWIWTMAIPKIYLGTEIQVENEEKFYSYALAICLQQLNDFRNNYYRQKELEESKTRTKVAIESLKYTQKSLRISIIGLIASIIVPIIVSIFTINCCTSTIKVEEQQYQQIKTLHNAATTHANDNLQ